jgi:NAD-dependent deacetylase
MPTKESPFSPVQEYRLKVAFQHSGDRRASGPSAPGIPPPRNGDIRACSAWIRNQYGRGIFTVWGCVIKPDPIPDTWHWRHMESRLGDRFTLITQNVDNLHILAGNSLSRTLQIHGNIFKVRCAAACTDDIFLLPDGLSPKRKGSRLTERERRRLTCPVCGNWIRPHVLWFDETYNERYYRFRSALEAAARTRLLITVGSAGATTLPNHIANLVHKNGGHMIDINVADNPFASLAIGSGQGIFVKSTSSEALAAMAHAVALVQSNL